MTHKVAINEALADWLADETHDDASNPFVRDNGRIYMRYDAVKLVLDAGNQLTVSLMYNGKERHSYPSVGAFLSGQVASLDGLEGRVELYVNREGSHTQG